MLQIMFKIKSTRKGNLAVAPVNQSVPEVDKQKTSQHNVRPKEDATEVSKSSSLAFKGKIIFPTQITSFVSKATWHLYRELTRELVIP